VQSFASLLYLVDVDAAKNSNKFWSAKVAENKLT
jgi:predicted DNA-binding WGR domain protein